MSSKFRPHDTLRGSRPSQQSNRLSINLLLVQNFSNKRGFLFVIYINKLLFLNTRYKDMTLLGLSFAGAACSRLTLLKWLLVT